VLTIRSQNTDHISGGIMEISHRKTGSEPDPERHNLTCISDNEQCST